MAHRDLTQTIPLVRDALLEEGADAPLSSVLGAMGISLLQVVEEPGPTRPMGPPNLADTAPSTGGRRALPSHLGRHEALGELGRGGMGVVLEARDPELRRVVAVKLVGNPRSITNAQLARFVAEAQITSQLQHPNIVPVHDIGYTGDGEIYFVMKKVEGRSLREILTGLRKGTLSDPKEWTLHRLLVIFVQICNAIAYAHDCGVLHRDLKPENIMLGPFGETLVMDWGVARVLGAPAESLVGDVIERITLSPTLDGVAVGTPGYMSPEQANGDLPALDPRSDVWSLGAILYELLTWQRAYKGTSLYAMLWAASNGPPDDPRRRTPERRIPDEIAEVCLRALRIDPADRYASAKDLADAVEAFLEGSRRRKAAAGYVSGARAAWQGHEALTVERRELSEREAELRHTIPPWATLERKAELLAARRRLAQLGPERAKALGNVLALCEYALGHDPGNPAAQRFLADVFHSYFVDAEANEDATWSGHYAERVRLYDTDGRYEASLAGTGTVSLRTDRPAQVSARPVQRDSLIWRPGEPIALGTTPIDHAPLAHGGWLFTLRAPGVRDVTYPVWLPRQGHWDSGSAVPLYSAQQIGAGFVYVAPGPARIGGDMTSPEAWPGGQEWVGGFFAAEKHVTLAEYVAFMNTLDIDEARARAPRREEGVKRGSNYLDERQLHPRRVGLRRPRPGRRDAGVVHGSDLRRRGHLQTRARRQLALLADAVPRALPLRLRRNQRLLDDRVPARAQRSDVGRSGPTPPGRSGAPARSSRHPRPGR